MNGPRPPSDNGIGDPTSGGRRSVSTLGGPGNEARVRHMAGAGGFEPPDGGIKIRCLTTWLRPNASQGSNGLGGKRADNSSGPPAPQWPSRTKFAPAEGSP